MLGGQLELIGNIEEEAQTTSISFYQSSHSILPTLHDTCTEGSRVWCAQNSDLNSYQEILLDYN